MIAAGKCRAFMFRPVQTVKRASMSILSLQWNLAWSLHWNFFEAQGLLQYTHVTFLGTYYQQCWSFLKAFYGFLGWVCGKRPGELWTRETLTVISGLFKYSLTCQSVEIPNKQLLWHVLWFYCPVFLWCLSGHEYSGTVRECLPKQSRHQTCLFQPKPVPVRTGCMLEKNIEGFFLWNRFLAEWGLMLQILGQDMHRF